MPPAALCKRTPGALTLVDLLAVTVEAYLDRADRQPGEPAGYACVEALAIGLELELHARHPERFGEREEMRHHQGLAAAQHHVRHLVAGDLGHDPHSLLHA